MPNYHFGAGNFEKDLWIDNKRVFTKPSAVDVEFTTPGAFDWVFVDATGKEAKTDRRTNEHGGWTSVDLASLQLFGDYSIGFRNVSGGRKYVKQGDVTHE